MQYKIVALLAVFIACFQAQAVIAQTDNVKSDPNQVSISDTKSSESEYHKTINFAEPPAKTTTGINGEAELPSTNKDDQTNSDSEQKKKPNSNDSLAIPLLIGAGAALMGSHGGGHGSSDATANTAPPSPIDGGSGSVLNPGTTLIKPVAPPYQPITRLVPESPSLLNFLAGFIALAGLVIAKRKKGSITTV